MKTIIYDALGKEQSRINTDIASSSSLDLQFLQNGMYYYSIISQHNIVKQGKFVLLK
ncbi:MAG: T9SS type A sorting domain-containing protein [Bacteroidota bacterium]